ncbi:MAG: flavodoxin family protein [Prevotella sp.]|nr:flavodoxin family protein [Prevotella sp.]
MMTIVLNTLDASDASDKICAIVSKEEKEVEVINTSDMKIAHCIGCNQCWLKTPGVCAIKDDYEEIVKKLVQASNLWIVSDTHFGFLNHRGKQVLDRLMPILNMYIQFRDGWMRHQLRYHSLNVGVIYKGCGDQQLLEEWCERTSQNLGGHSLGAIAIDAGDHLKRPDKGRNTILSIEPMTHVVIINGSPRTRKHSNTDKIIQSFAKGLEENDITYELYSLSSRKEWDAAHEAFITHNHLIFALPLYVECVPSLMLEFLESLPTERQCPAVLSFILHGGFDEGHQLRLGERFLKSLPEQLGCIYGGCLVRGGSFMIRMRDDKKLEKMVEKMLTSYTTMGRSFAHSGNFQTSEAKKFTGAERYPWLLRQLFGLILKGVVKKRFEYFAKQWGCTRPLDDKVYLSNEISGVKNSG